MAAFQALSPRKLVREVFRDKQAIAMASLFSDAHGYACELTLVELSNGTFQIRSDGDLVQSNTPQTLETIPFSIRDCLAWAKENRVKNLNVDKPMCRVSRLVLADRSSKWVLNVNRIEMGDSPVEQIVRYLFSGLE